MLHLPFIYKLDIITRLSGTNKSKNRKVRQLTIVITMLKFLRCDEKYNFLYKPLWSNLIEINFDGQWATFDGKYENFDYFKIFKKEKISNIKINNQTFLQDLKKIRNKIYITTKLTEDELFRILKSFPVMIQTMIGANESNLLLTKPYRLRYKSHLGTIRQYVDEEKNKYFK